MDPFKITGPTCISFSGGRTSAYMLWRVLQSNGGLPSDAVVCFANTGKEEEATLRFVRDCGEQWGVPITWVEYRDDEQKYAVVAFDTAAREGEPFEAIIRKRNYLPNPVTRFCTIELKIRPMARHLFSLGMGETMDECENASWIGIRADEQRRAAKIADKSRIPLVTADVTLADIELFWIAQPFRLELTTVNGRTLSGNCDLCFLKAGNQIQTLIAQKPERAIWWAKMEGLGLALASKPSGAVFRSDRPSYAAMLQNVTDQKDAFGFEDDAIACYCGE
jgi:3'-phosphoadenosine 5'-phosphosulfate sulfotransferase (PAPS reductase)/FAD synthetase